MRGGLGLEPTSQKRDVGHPALPGAQVRGTWGTRWGTRQNDERRTGNGGGSGCVHPTHRVRQRRDGWGTRLLAEFKS